MSVPGGRSFDRTTKACDREGLRSNCWLNRRIKRYQSFRTSKVFWKPRRVLPGSTSSRTRCNAVWEEGATWNDVWSYSWAGLALCTTSLLQTAVTLPKLPPTSGDDLRFHRDVRSISNCEDRKGKMRPVGVYPSLVHSMS